MKNKRKTMLAQIEVFQMNSWTKWITQRDKQNQGTDIFEVTGGVNCATILNRLVEFIMETTYRYFSKYKEIK